MISFFILFSMKVMQSSAFLLVHSVLTKEYSAYDTSHEIKYMIWWFDIHRLCRVITKIKINTNPPLHIVDIDSALFFVVRMLKIYSNQLSSFHCHISCNHHTVPWLFRTSSCKWKRVPFVLYHVGCHMTCRKDSLHIRHGAWTGLGNCDDNEELCGCPHLCHLKMSSSGI